MKWAKQVLDFLLFTHIYLGICVVGVYMAFALKPIGEATRIDFILFVFFSTVSVYSMLRLRSVGDDLMVTSQYLRWAASYMSIAQWVMRFAIVATAVTFLFLKRSEQVAVLALGVVWILYNLPFFSRERIKFGLRYIWFLKPLVVGFIITGIAAIVPYQDNSPYYTAEFVPVVFILFCFVSSLVVVFEIKDRSSDAAFGTQTIATKAGVRGTKIGAIALLLVAVLAFLGSHLSMSDRGLLRYVSPFLLLILFILLFIDAHTNEYVYWVVIDGWMIYLGIYWYLLNHHIIHY